MKKISFWLIVVLAITLLSSLPFADAQTDTSTGTSAPVVKSACTPVWLTNPSYYGEVSAGSKRCLALKKDDWIEVYKSNGVLLDFVHPQGFTKRAPHSGDGSKAAERIKSLAKRHNVKLQFALTDTLGRTGCNPKGFATSVSGTYTSSPKAPGQGLIRLGTGKYKSCIGRYSTKNVDLAKHEISHAIMERKCDGRNVYREENTTDAYAYRYLGAGRAAGNYGFTRSDLARAIKVHAGRC